MSNLQCPEIDSYDGLLDFMGGKTDKRVCHNTRATHIEDGKDSFIVIVYHSTAIVTYWKDGTFRVTTGGWETPTTKERINKLTPLAIFQHRGDWFHCGGKPFSSGVFYDAEVERAREALRLAENRSNLAANIEGNK